MRIENIIDLYQHYVEIPDNKLGIKRKVYIDNFSFSPTYKKFSLVVCIKHYYPLYEKIAAEYKDGELIREEYTITHQNQYGNYIDDMNSIIDLYDEFVGDNIIMVYFNPMNLEDMRNGEILNPDRNPISEDVPHISQYEYIYMAFTSSIVCLDMIKNLLQNYTNWKE